MNLRTWTILLCSCIINLSSTKVSVVPLKEPFKRGVRSYESFEDFDLSNNGYKIPKSFCYHNLKIWNLAKFLRMNQSIVITKSQAVIHNPYHA